MKVLIKENPKTIKYFYIKNINALIKFLKYNKKSPIKRIKKIPKHIRKKLIIFLNKNDNIYYTHFKKGLFNIFYSSNVLSKKYWLCRGYSRIATKKMINKFSIKYHSIFKKYCQNNTKKYKGFLPVHIEYWLKRGYSKKEAKEIIKKRQSTNTIEAIQKRFNCSLKEAQKIRDKITKKWQKTLKSKSPREIRRINKSKGLTRQDLIKKHGLKKALLILKNKGFNYDKHARKHGKKSADKIAKWLATNGTKNAKHQKSSKISRILFKSLLKHKFKDYKFCHFYGLNQEIVLHDKRRYFYYDFAVINEKNKKIIEFQGNYFHANPKMYDKNYYHKLYKMKASEIWKKDAHKKRVALNNKFKYLIIWEKDYKIDKERVIKKCLKFLNK